MKRPTSIAGLVGTAMAIACGGVNERLQPSAVEAEVSEDISTVVHVRFESDDPTIGYVEYGPEGALDLSTPPSSEQSREHDVTLLGLKADTEYSFRAVTLDGDAPIKGDVRRIRTGHLPAGTPSLTQVGDGHDRFTIVPILGSTTAVTIIDPDGDIVWYHEDDRDLDFYRVRLSVDGKSLVYNAASVSGDPADDSELVRVALDGSETSSIEVPLLAHDFVEHPDGTLAAIAVEYREFEGEMLRGDKIVEVDPEDGEQTTVWTSWDCFDPSETPGDDIEHGWTFANALDFDPDQDAYYLGMRNFSSIARIDRASGECEWVLGLDAATIEFEDGSARFLHQHQFDLAGDRMVVLDNDGMAGNESRVLEYELDLESGVASEVWRYSADPTVYTFALGEVTRLDDGTTFVNWSSAGQMERVTPEGERTWQLNSRAGVVFGFHTLAESLYRESPSFGRNY